MDLTKARLFALSWHNLVDATMFADLQVFNLLKSRQKDPDTFMSVTYNVKKM